MPHSGRSSPSAPEPGSLAAGAVACHASSAVARPTRPVLNIQNASSGKLGHTSIDGSGRNGGASTSTVWCTHTSTYSSLSSSGAVAAGGALRQRHLRASNEKPTAAEARALEARALEADALEAGVDEAGADEAGAEEAGVEEAGAEEEQGDCAERKPGSASAFPHALLSLRPLCPASPLTS